MSFHVMRLMMELILNAHLFLRCRAAFGWGWQLIPLFLWILLMLNPGGLFPNSLPFVFKVKPLWTPALLLFLTAALGLDLLRLLLGLAGLVSGHSWWSLLAARRAVPLALVLTVIVGAHSCYMARRPSLKHVVVYSDKLPEDVDSIRIAQLSDAHLSDLIGLEDLKRMAALISEARPDILVATGDIVDGDMRGRDEEAALLASLSPRYGSYAVFGNHERYAGLVNSARFGNLNGAVSPLNFLEKAGFTILRGRAVEAGGIVVAGFDDESIRATKSADAVRLLRECQKAGLFVLLLKHRPKPVPGTEGLYDLQLSGHTHGGQIWPGHFMVKAANNGYLYGLHPGGKGEGAVYVSRGSGFWGMPMRFLAPPEVNLIEIVRKN